VAAVKFKWEVDPGLQADKLRDGLYRTAVRRSMLKAMVPFKSAVIASAPAILGHLRAAQKIKVTNPGGKEKPSPVWCGMVGASKSFKRVRRYKTGKRTRTVERIDRKTGEKKQVKVVHQPSRYQWIVDQGSKRSKGRKFMKKAAGMGKGQFEVVFWSKLGSEIEVLLNR
jgi:hypothetical protein